MIGKVAPGSTLELFQFAIFTHLPILIFGPLFGTLIDRSNKAFILVIVDVVRAAIVVCIPAYYHLMDSLYAFYIPVFFLSLANLLFAPAKSAVIPEVFAARHLLKINAVLWMLGIIATVAGFFLGGWLFDYHSWELSFYSDAASYFFSALLLVPLFILPRFRSSPFRRAAPHSERTSWNAGLVAVALSVRDGLVLVKENTRIGLCLAVQTALFASGGILYVLGVARLQEVFPFDRTIYLSIAASSGTAGLLVGSVLATVGRRRLSQARLIASSAILVGVALVGIGASSSLVAMSLWATVAGIAFSPMFILTETLLQQETPEDYRGRIFATREIVTRTSFLVVTMAAGIAGAVADKGIILIAIGLLLAVAGVTLVRKDFLKV